MAKFKIISKDGSTVRYEGKLRYNGTYLKPSYIEFPEISSPVPIKWEVGDYVDYGRTGMRYHLYSIPQASKVTKRDTDRIKGYEADGTPIYVNAYGGAFVYSNVQLHASTKDLEIAPFRDLVSNDNKRHFSTSPDVVTTENVEGIARRIQSCMDDFYPNKWIIRVESLTEEYSDAKDFALTGGTCLDALSKIYELWDDLGWIHTYEDGKEVITIGYANKRTSSNTTDPYIYGKGNGLTAIKKNQTNKDEFATRLYIYGSERNLPARYYHQMGISAVGGTDIRHLMLPMRVWGKTNGGSDPRKAYLENASAVAKYGVIPKTHYFDSVDAGADIYPSIEGMTAGSLRSAMSVSSDYYPSNRYSDSERMDEVISGDGIEDSGTVSEDGSSYTELKRFAIDNSYSTINIPAGSTVIESERHIILTHSFNENGKAKVVVNAEANGYILDAGFKSVTLMVEICDSLTDETVSEVMEIPLVKLENGDWVFNLPKEMSVKYDKTDYNNFAVYYSVYASIELEEEATEDKTSELTVLSGNYVVTLTDILASTFNITLKQIGFNIDDRAANGNKKTISMKTGLCAGRSFAIERCTYNADVDTWTLTCRRQKDNTLGALFPNTSYHIYGGDRFVLTDIAMPNIYVSVAMERLLAEGEKLLARASKVQNNYEPSIDAKVMAKSGRSLREGMYMEITDEDIVDGNTDYILIDSLNIYEDEDAIPTYKVTLRERKKVTYKGTPSASSTSDTSSVEDDEDKSLEGYATEKYVDEGDKALTERIDKLSVLLDWFFKYDDDTIGTNFNLFSLGQVSAGGIGTSGDGGGEGDGTGEGFLLINSWPVSGDYSSYALGANLGIELNERLKKIEDGEITPDLTGYATQDWVLERGYLTSADLSGYALKSDVDALKEFFDGVEDQDALINKWHELEDFLAGVEEGDKLLAMVANNDTQISNLTKWVTALDKDVTEMKGLVEGFDTRITYFEDMFEWVLDDNGNRIAIRAKSSFFSEHQVAAGGIGESIGLGSGGGITGIVVNGQTYNEPDEMGVLTLPNYPTSLLWSDIEDKPSFAAVATSGSYNDLSDKPAIPSLSGYATQQWVLSQGFAVASSLGGLAYKDGISWSEVSGRPTKLSDFTDDILSGKYLPIGGNAASATKLADNTAFTAWGQTFFENGKPKNVTSTLKTPSGYNAVSILDSYLVLGQGMAENSKPTYLDGYNVYMRYGNSSTIGLLLNDSGNVTIGDSDLAGTAYRLRVNGRTYLEAYNGNDTFVRIGASNAFGLHVEARNNGDTYFQSQRFDATTAYYNIVLQELGGNILIGTTTDNGQKFQVNGNVRIYDNVIIGTSNYEEGRLRVVGESGATNVFVVTDYNGSTKFSVLNNGNVGIGTSTPAYKLDVNGEIHTSDRLRISSGKDSKLIFNNTDGEMFTGILFQENGTLYNEWSITGEYQYFGTKPLLLNSYSNDGYQLSVGGKGYFSGTLTLGNSTSGTLKIGGATLSWDDANKALKIDTGFYSLGQIAAGGIGTESEGSGSGTIGLLFDSTKTWADYTSDMADYALAAYHGKALNDRLVAVEAKAGDYLPITGGTMNGSILFGGRYSIGSSTSRVGGVYAIEANISASLKATNINVGSITDLTVISSSFKSQGIEPLIGNTFYLGSDSSRWKYVYAVNINTGDTVTEYVTAAADDLTLSVSDHFEICFYDNYEGENFARFGYTGSRINTDLAVYGALKAPSIQTPDGDDLYLKGSIVLSDGSNEYGYLYSDSVDFLTDVTVNGASVATQTWADGRYLKLSGGTINGNLSLKSWLYVYAVNPDVYVRFYNDESFMGGLGIKEDKTPLFSDYRGYFHTLIHSGNVGDYKAGGIVAFDSRNKNYSPYANEFSRKALTVHFERALSVGYGTSDYNVCILNVSPWVSNSAGAEYQLAFRHDGAIGHRYGSTTWSDWKTIAFLDDNVASATKLATARTIWGQSFDGTGNVRGDLYLEKSYIRGIGNKSILGADSVYNIDLGYGCSEGGGSTFIHGKQVALYRGTSHTLGFLLNSSGNVTIGSSDLAGTDYKFVVNGLSRFKNNVESDGNVIGAGAVYAKTSAHGFVSLQVGSTGNKGLLDSRTSWIIYTDGANTFLPQGNVLIGTSTDSGYKLDVNGEIHTSDRLRISSGKDSKLIFNNTDGEMFTGILFQENGTLYNEWSITGEYQYFGTKPLLLNSYSNDGYQLSVGGKGYFSGALTLGNSTSGTLKIGGATLSWDDANKALKIDTGLYSLGQIAAGGIGAEGDNIATYNKWGGLKPAYSTTGKATLTTTSAAFTNSPTIAARTTTAGRYYAVEMDAVGRAFVNVPWVNTNYWTLDSSVSRIYPADTARQLCVGGTGSDAYNTSTYKLIVHGSAFAISGTWQSSSDMTMKDVVKDIDLDIKDIANAPSFAFTWKGSEDKTEWLGTSAQYWKTILPTAVKGEEGSYSLSYGELALTTAIAIAKKTMNHEDRIKELELQVKTLKDRLSVYEN